MPYIIDNHGTANGDTVYPERTDVIAAMSAFDRTYDRDIRVVEINLNDMLIRDVTDEIVAAAVECGELGAWCALARAWGVGSYSADEIAMDRAERRWEEERA